MKKDWRETQKKFFVEDVEFEQDQRIINYFKIKDIPTLGYGSISYFSNKIKFVKNLEFYKQALFIFNQKIEKNYLFYFVRKLKNKMINNSRICIAINKFLITCLKSDKINLFTGTCCAKSKSEGKAILKLLLPYKKGFSPCLNVIADATSEISELKLSGYFLTNL